MVPLLHSNGKVDDGGVHENCSASHGQRQRAKKNPAASNRTTVHAFAFISTIASSSDFAALQRGTLPPRGKMFEHHLVTYVVQFDLVFDLVDRAKWEGRA